MLRSFTSSATRSLPSLRGNLLRSTSPIMRLRLASYSTEPTITELRDTEMFAKFVNSEKPSVIDFYATWCGPCKAIAPIFDKIAAAVPEAQFARVDVDEAQDVAGKNEISAMPTILFFKNGEQSGKIVGADLQQLVKLIEENTGVDIKSRKL
ncbi:hypothetical protein ACI3LY_003718 [Candidozyma auris]|nr:thioredoxin [[Candida] auris]PSK75015.1 thioredoxin [[Candida] auris]